MKKRDLIFKYLKSNIGSFCLIILSAIIFVLAHLFIPIISGYAIDSIFAQDYDNFTKYIIFIAVLIVLAVCFEYIFQVLSAYFIQSVSMNIRNDLFEKYNKLSIKNLDKYNQGDLLVREINDIENISNGLSSGFRQLFQGIISIIAMIAIMFYLNWLLALIIVLISPISIYVAYYIAKNCKKYFKLQADQTGNLSSFSMQNLNNLIISKSFNQEKVNENEFKNLDAELYKYGQKAQFYSSWINPSTRLLNSITYCFVLLTGVFIILYPDIFSNIGLTLTVGGLQSLLVYASQYSKPFNEISSTVTELQNASASFNRIYEILCIKNEKYLGSARVFDIDDVNLSNVKFSYIEDKLIINDMSFEIKKGSRISIVGKTGCGKTTLINLLMGFYKINDGEIKYNNLNIDNLDINSLRDNIAMVLQDTWIFNGTIKENIAFGSENVSDEEIIEAAKKAQAHNFIIHLTDGYDTKISSISGLSIGEMQLICIARAILKDSNFVILDEATSNIDALTEDKVSKAFDKLLTNKTSIVIAHRLATIKNSDLILVLDKGKIIEQGNHDELIKMKGYYFDLYNSQYQ